MTNYNNLPIEFESMGVLDERFTKVKIWIAHTGENRNRSVFSKEVLEAMIPSLTNTPILGYITVTEDGEQDFKGHEERLVLENNELKFKYEGRAWGLIPEKNNAHFEFRYGEDGVEREYLVTEGVLWTSKFPEVEEIFDRDGGFKSQSMELFPPSVKGYADEHGLFVFTEAKFEGATILGEDVTPAMVSSTIEKFSIANHIKTEFSEMLTEFNKHFALAQEKGDDILENTEQPVLDQETEFSETEATEEAVVNPESTEETEFTEGETPEETEATEFTEATEETPETQEEAPAETEFTEEAPVEEVPSEPVTEMFELKFELSHADIRSSLYGALNAHDSFSNGWNWISTVYDNHAIVENETDEGTKFYKVNYVKHETGVSLGDHEEMFPMFVNSSEKQALDIARNSFEALEGEVKELRTYKAKVERSAKEAKLANYTASLSAEEYKTIHDSLDKFSETDMEKEIAFLLFKKNQFSAQPQDEQPSRVGVVSTEDNFKYGTASKYFTKN
ncbi:hypothetical protein V7094_28265 [Priestia megaterium]|uniref:hypothetical protein n=1 Tax=Priestia megaterium TaxID=1404 RepID=UPI002FFFBD40